MKIFAFVAASALLASTVLSVAQTAAPAQNPAASTTSGASDAPAPGPKPECGDDLAVWIDNFAKEARAEGVSDKAIAELRKAKIDDRVLGFDRKQTVFNLTFTDFSRRLISDARLKKGREMLQKYADIFKKVEDTYGVPGPVLAAFWGLETDYGAIQGKFDTLDALVTLSHDCRRPELFRPQLMALLKLFDKGEADATTTGAWAGEIGMTQLLPKDYLERGVDGDGDGKVDLKHSVADAMMTAGRMISELGWKRGEPWLVEVRLTKELPWQEAVRTNRKPNSWWAAQGVTGMDGPLPADNGVDASLLLPQGRKGPAFLSYPNFDVYVEWNKSIVYAMTAAYFATRLGGASAFDPGNPEPGLTQDEMKQLQAKLQARGYDMGKIDGVYGVATRDAVRAEQMRLGLPADSWPTKELLDKL